MASSITRPEVEVIQEIQTITPTAAVPTLVPCIVGPCFEIIDPVAADGSANIKAKVAVPAVVTGTDSSAKKAVGGKTLRVTIDGVTQTFDFPTTSDGNIKTALIASMLESGIGAQAALKNVKVSVAEWDEDNETGKIRFTSTSSGGQSSIEFHSKDGDDVLLVDDAYAELGLDSFTDKKVSGADAYTNQEIVVPFEQFPVDKAASADDLTIDVDSIELLFDQGEAALTALAEDEAVLAHRKRIGTTTIHEADVSLGDTLEDNTTVLYVSQDGLNGSGITVEQAPVVVTTALFGLTFKDAAESGGDDWTAAEDLHNASMLVPFDAGTFTSAALKYAVGDEVTVQAGGGVVGVVTAITSEASASPTATGTLRINTLTNAVDVDDDDVLEFTAPGALGVKFGTSATASADATMVHGGADWVAAGVKFGELEASDLDANGDPVAVGALALDETDSDKAPAAGDNIVGDTSGREAEVTDYAAGPVATVAGTDITVNFVAGDNTSLAPAAVNFNPVAKDLVHATACDDGAGDLATDGPSALVNRTLTFGPEAILDHTGKPKDDGDSDLLTPQMYARGSVAQIVLAGSGDALLTLQAKGDQNSKDEGARHGVLGNALSVKFTLNGSDATVSAVEGGTVINVKLAASGGAINTAKTTPALIKAAIMADAASAALVVATASGTGAFSELLNEMSLAGGADPIDFSATGTAPAIVGARTNSQFLMDFIKLVGSPTFDVGDVLSLAKAGNDPAVDPTDDTTWSVIGTIRAIEPGNILWLDTTGAGATVPLAGDSVGTEDTEALGTISVYHKAGLGSDDAMTIAFDGEAPVSVDFDGETDLPTIAGLINTAVGTDVAFVQDRATTTAPGSWAQPAGILKNPRGVLCLRHESHATSLGLEGTIELQGSAVEKIFGLRGSSGADGVPAYLGVHEGTPHPVIAGDELLDGTTSKGLVNSVKTLKIGGVSFTGSMLTLSLDSVGTNKTLASWWVKAKNLVSGTSGRPEPGFTINTVAKTLTINSGQSRSSDGLLAPSANFPFYVGYKGLRLDVTPADADPALMAFSSTTDLDAELGPITPDNPLAFGIYMALLNATGVQVSGIGVDEASTLEPDGTFDAYVRALEFLESKEVYALAPLTQSRPVHDVVAAHVTAMSASSQKKERIAFVNGFQPVEKEPTLGGSGEADNSALNVLSVDISKLNVATALSSLGLSAGQAPSVYLAAGLYVRVATSPLNYLVTSVVGQDITVKLTGFDPGDNDDNFYADTDDGADTLDPDVTPMLVPDGTAMTLYKRGADIAETTSTGKQQQIEAMAGIGGGYANRRLFWVQPDRGSVLVNSLETEVPGYYFCAATAGMVGRQHPSQPFTNLPIIGFVRSKNSNKRFTEAQMNEAAGGGVYWIVQDVEGGVITARHQLSTNVASLEVRELSITKALDFASKFLRNGLKGFVGKNNISDGFLDSLGMLLNGQVATLTTARVARSMTINALAQDEDSPDVVAVDVSFLPYYPCNAIRLTLVI